MRTQLSVIVAGILLICLPLHDAHAGGIILYELGTSDVGRASAGWAARAGDASTLFTNPAGMSRLPAQQLLVGGQTTYGNFGFLPNQNTNVAGNDGGNPVEWVPTGSVFYTHALGSRWHAGIGTFSYFGLAAEYDQGWLGRYYVQKTHLIGLSVMPAVSYRANEHFSLGAGLNWMFGFLGQENALRNVLQQKDATFKLDDNTQGFGADVGALWEFNDRSRVGVSYVSQVKLDFSDVPEITGSSPVWDAVLSRAGILGASIDLGIHVPHMVMASGYHELSDRWSVMGNVGWQNWNKFGKVDVAVADTLLATTTDLHYKDTWHGALGVEYNTMKKWIVTGGIAYDSSPVDDQYRTVTLPMGEIWRFGLGGTWTMNETMRLGLAYQLAWMGNMTVDQYRQIGTQIINRVSGDFASTAMHAIALNLTWDI